MSLRDRLRQESGRDTATDLLDRFGILTNPFPASNQTLDNPRYPQAADEDTEERIVAFFRDGKSQAVIVEGTQGVGKTNFLNHWESQIRSAVADRDDYYFVRYLADPESSFEATTRRIFEALGTEHLRTLADRIERNESSIENARGHDMKTALRRLRSDPDVADEMLEWLSGLRLLKVHRQKLGVQFRLDTVESKTAALRDIVQVSARVGALNGIFLLLDELEKQDGVLGPKAVVRYLSAVRAIIDALPEWLFLMVAITPDALARYSTAYPALQGRLQNRIELKPLTDVSEAVELAEFYMKTARRKAREASPKRVDGGDGGDRDIVKRAEIEECYRQLAERAPQRGDEGVRQREFLHRLHIRSEEVLQSVVGHG